MMQRNLRIPLSAVAAAFALGACTIAGAANDTEKSNDDITASSGIETNPDTVEINSPLSEYLGLLWGVGMTYEQREAQRDQQFQRQQELVAQCMLAAGFEYQPVPRQMFARAIGSNTHFDDRDWVAQNGWGLVSGWTESAEWDTPDDPNAEYVANLSPTAQISYGRALWGREYPDQGCWGYMRNPEEDLRNSVEFFRLFDAMDQMWATANDEVKQTDFSNEWSICMADAGFIGYLHPLDLQESFSSELHSFFVNLSPEDHENRANLPETQSLIEREIKMALADFDCRDSVNFDERSAAFFRNAESQFVTDHRTYLEALRTTIEQWDN